MKAKTLAAAMAVFLVSAVAGTASAAKCVQNDNIIDMVGVDQSDGTIYAKRDGTAGNCGCASFRWYPVNNTHTGMILSVLLAAKLSGTPVRIDILDENNCNSAYRAYLQ